MPDYRRNRVPGGTFFFTVNLLDRRSSLLVSEIVRLREAVAHTLRERPFHIDAWVVLPDHLHAMWTLPEGDDDYSGRWRAIKKRFSWAMPSIEARSQVQLGRAERGIWQRRFWEHTVRDERDFAAHMDYIHINPVKHGVASFPASWPFSSFHRAVRQGLYPAHWHLDHDPAGEWGEADETKGGFFIRPPPTERHDPKTTFKAPRSCSNKRGAMPKRGG
jgi:putative transposase